jgi:AcrR family transcriptional regulator
VTQTQTARALRADAQRNREKLLVAAVERFAESGTDASLEAIAKDAGVGIGTLYRHFPTRDALVEAAYRNEVERLCGAAQELLRDHPADVALAEWMDRFVAYAAAKRGMSEALQSVVASGSSLFADARAQMVEAIATLLNAGAAAGTIRADVDPEDVLRAMGSVWLVTGEPDWQERARRLLGLLMDGLRYGA